MNMEEAYHAFCMYIADNGIETAFLQSCGVACAFSGGADSMLLLTLLHYYCSSKSMPLHAIHIHHGIRGETADRDAAFCEHFCRENDIPFTLCRINVPAYAAEKKCGLEEAAREKRYQALYANVPAQYVIATAHNATDQVETVLFHLCRGSGLRGLCGIAPVRGQLVRPLLWITSEEIRNLCHSAGIPYMVDETNSDTTYTRNYIRQEILPRLRNINTEMENSIRQTTELLTKDEQYIAEIVASAVQKIPNRVQLNDLPLTICSRVLRDMYESALQIHNMSGNLAKKHIDAMVQLLQGDRIYAHLSLPGGVLFQVDHDVISFVVSAEEEKKQMSAFLYTISPSGEEIWENERYILCITKPTPASQKNQEKKSGNRENIYKISMQQWLDFAKIKGVPCVRVRRDGDTIRYGGLTRRVKKLFSDRKLPLAVRNSLPLLVDDNGIVWLPGFPLRDNMESGEVTGKEDWRLLILYDKALDGLQKDFLS